MAEFIYTARDKEGKVVSDILEAPSREALIQSLRAQGLLPTQVKEKRRFFLNFQSLASRLGHVSLLEKLTFIKNLAVTIRAGLPVSRALRVLTRQMPNPYFRQVVGELTNKVEGGKSLSAGMAEYPRVFSSLAVSMVAVGEQTGELDKSLEYLATQISRDYNLLRRTKGALTYPAVVVSALVIIGYLMFTFVLPKLIETFKEFQVELPILTRVIIRTVDLFSRYSIAVLVIFVFLVTAFVLWRKTANGRAVLHRLTLSLPIFGGISKKLNLARFTIIFSGLLRSGMPIVEALKTTSKTMTNLYYQRALVDASEKVKVGVDLVVVLEKYPKLFTPMVTQMIQVGEESGTMEEVLAEVSSFYETEVDDTVKNLSSIIEPVLVIIIGVVVGLLAVGLIMPIYNIGQSIS
jgi:type IV pilus assembly protein PilC